MGNNKLDQRVALILVTMPDVKFLLEKIKMILSTFHRLANTFISIPIKEREEMHVNDTDIYNLD